MATLDYEAIYSADYFHGKTSHFYRLGYGRFAKFHFDSLVRPILRYLRELGPGKVLDVGCAYGLVLQRLPEPLEKFGVDVSEHAIAEARKRVPQATLAVANAEERLPFPEGFFDAVLCNDVIEHLEHPARALMRIRDVLRDDGLLYLNTPNLNWIRRRLFAEADEKEHHVSLFEHARLLALLGELGFDVVDHWTYTDLTHFFFPKFRSSVGIESAFICKKR